MPGNPLAMGGLKLLTAQGRPGAAGPLLGAACGSQQLELRLRDQTVCDVPLDEARRADEGVRRALGGRRENDVFERAFGLLADC